MTQENPTPGSAPQTVDYGTPNSGAPSATQDERNMALLLYILAIVTVTCPQFLYHPL